MYGRPGDLTQLYKDVGKFLNKANEKFNRPETSDNEKPDENGWRTNEKSPLTKDFSKNDYTTLNIPSSSISSSNIYEKNSDKNTNRKYSNPKNSTSDILGSKKLTFDDYVIMQKIAEREKILNECNTPQVQVIKLINMCDDLERKLYKEQQKILDLNVSITLHEQQARELMQIINTLRRLLKINEDALIKNYEESANISNHKILAAEKDKKDHEAVILSNVEKFKELCDERNALNKQIDANAQIISDLEATMSKLKETITARDNEIKLRDEKILKTEESRNDYKTELLSTIQDLVKLREASTIAVRINDIVIDELHDKIKQLHDVKHKTEKDNVDYQTQLSFANQELEKLRNKQMTSDKQIENLNQTIFNFTMSKRTDQKKEIIEKMTR